MTVSAEAKLIPRPPARVESRKAKSGDPGALKCSMDFFRMSEGTVPANETDQMRAALESNKEGNKGRLTV